MTTIALITGGNRGIGFETGRALAARGMTVILGSRDLARGNAAAAELSQGAAEVVAVQLDVTDDASVTRAAAWIDDRFGRLDVLVNNAGIPTALGRRAVPTQTNLDDMRAVYETNVFGAVRVTCAMAALLKRSKAGRVVNVSSEIGSITNVLAEASPVSDLPPNAQYSSSKAALNMITRQLAKELRADGILVNAANPGWTATDFGGGHGHRTPAQGAEPLVHLATLPDDGPTGTFYGHLWVRGGDGDGGYGELPW